MPPPMDAYTLRARLLPALISGFPAGLVVTGFYVDGITLWTPVWGLFVSAGGAYLLAELGRDAGKRKEPALWKSWGGAPTTQLLRHRNARNPHRTARAHDLLHALRTDLPFPSPEEELSDPESADLVYEEGIRFLRNRTRDRTKHHVVYEALCEYGFRRNLWGMKPLGIAISVSALVATVAIAFVHSRQFGVLTTAPLAAALTTSALYLVLWIGVIRTDWVRLSAFAYAERLVESLESLSADC